MSSTQRVMMNMIPDLTSLDAIAEALRRGREARNLTQRQLGAIAGLHQAQVARAEGGADLRLSTLLELAHAAGLEIVLAPQSLVPAIMGLMGATSASQATSEAPLYALDEDD